MKNSEIAEKYGINEMRFELFISREAEKRGIRTKGLFQSGVADEDVERAVREFKAYEVEEFGDRLKREAAHKEQQKQIENAKKEMILSTCPSIDGFRITRQLGLVFGECAYKTGFFKTLSASIDNFGDSLSFGDKELSGTSRILESAREYAIQKMISAAAEKGANAIVGIDSESSMGGEVMHVTIYGTAVRIERAEES